MIRDRRSGPILIILLAVAIGSSCTSGAGSAGSGGTSGSAGSGGTSGSAGSGGTSGNAGSGGGGGVAGALGGSTGGGGGGTTGAGGTAGTTGGTAGTTGAGGASGTTGAGGGGGGTTGAGGTAGTTGGTAGTTGAGGTAGAGGGGFAGSAAGSIGGGAAGAIGGSGAGATAGDPTAGSYRLTCDGSMAVMIDATHFLDGNDEEQGMRLYTRGIAGSPLTTIDISGAIGLSTGDEADFEDAARIANRIYVIGSHGRNKNGKLERARYRFFAMDVAGTTPAITLGVPGYTTTLLDQMLEAQNWDTPDSNVIATLTAASNLSRSTDPALPPLAGGTNIEGLSWSPTASQPNQLLIGFRNPLQGGRAIVVSLLNADTVVTGGTPRFGEATLLDLGGLGIRGMAWSPVHAAVLLLGGPKDDAAGPFRLFEWSGAAAAVPVAVADITGVPTTSAPEAIVTYPDTRDVQVLFDQGDHDVGGSACKDADEAVRVFGDVIVHVP